MYGKIEKSLSRVHKVALPGGIVDASLITRRDLVTLQTIGYLERIMKGWYFLKSPQIMSKETADSLFRPISWDFFRAYSSKLGRYCLTPASSAPVWNENPELPGATSIIVEEGGNRVVNLPAGKQLVIYKAAIPKGACLQNGIMVTPRELAFQKSKEIPLFDEKRTAAEKRLELYLDGLSTDVHAVGVPSNLPLGKFEDYLEKMNKSMERDARNSLTIEGYHVTDELMAHFSDPKWKPDPKLEDAVALRGYRYALESVQQSLGKIFNGVPAAKVVDEDHQTWFQEMHKSVIAAGQAKSYAFAGYRNVPVVIRNSTHVPPAFEKVPRLMGTLFECVAKEQNAVTAAILLHAGFVYVHPYRDGNGRISRFLMNVMRAGGGHDWHVIEKDDRDLYFRALELSRSEDASKRRLAAEALVAFIAPSAEHRERSLSNLENALTPGRGGVTFP